MSSAPSASPNSTPLPAAPMPDMRTAADRTLPVYEKREDIIRAIGENQVVIIAGETGSGKTTQLPLLSLESGRGMSGAIAITQPRRIAATSLAAYTAKRCSCAPGTFVGHRVRFDERTSSQTKIVYMTDGILLTDITADPLLRRYDTIILDEAHERSLTIDFLMGYLRQLLPRRPDLKVIISSATIDTKLFSLAFNNAPIIEVSGRLFPVDILYQPPQTDAGGDGSYVDGAVEATKALVAMGEEGDILLFLPTAQDITETVARLKHLEERDLLVLPLYGKLSAQDQNRVFSPHRGRKIIVGTNIAETSITVPGIRFVVDTGLARTVRYTAQTRTTRMPIEPISQASANQRAGRCGRVRDGICIRLYAQEDYDARFPYTIPEIQRANLAGVILQMHAMGLGNIATFPFVEPPSQRSVAEGLRQLRELGALSDTNRLTNLGRRMARLPLDPCIARMVLQAAHEKCLHEIKIIAAGLTVVDPRERPTEKREQADQAHKRFADPHSDFLLYLSLWNTYQDRWNELKTQSSLRTFCRQHFLSFLRMREWHDIHHQLDKICSRMNGLRDNREPASYEAIHKSLLAGLLMNVAVKGEGLEYLATRGRTVHLFPGSSLYKGGQRWIVCHEIVETSRVFARTAARIDPQWLEQLFPNLCRSSYAEPSFDETTGTVRAFQKVTFFGLPIAEQRPVYYGRINRAEATTVFVVAGLVEGRLRSHHPFLKHNLDIRNTVETMEAKLRTRGLYAGDTAVVDFYRQHLAGIAGIHDLNRWIKRHNGDRLLRMKLEDLLSAPLPEQLDRFPDMIIIGEHRFGADYRFEPGKERDGITVTVPSPALEHIHLHAFEWILPVLWPQRIESLAECLPKPIRKRLFPLEQTCRTIADGLAESGRSFADAVLDAFREITGAAIPGTYARDLVPQPYVWPRVEVVNRKGETIETFYPPGLPRQQTARDNAAMVNHPFGHLIKRELTHWDFGPLPQRVEHTADGQALFGYPALKCGVHGVDIAILRSETESQQVHRVGITRLFELALADELAWIKKDVHLPRATALACAPYTGVSAVEGRLAELVLEHFLEPSYPLPRTKPAFEQQCMARREKIKGIGHKTVTLFGAIVQELQAVHKLIPKVGPLVAPLKSALNECTAAIFADGFTYARLEQYPRYLRSLGCRASLAHQDPLRCRERMQTLDNCRSDFVKLAVPDRMRYPQLFLLYDDLWMAAEELAISLFAQAAVKTLYPISPKRFAVRLAKYHEQCAAAAFAPLKVMR